MKSYFYTPIIWNGEEFFQNSLLSPDELELFSRENYEEFIRENFDEFDSIVQFDSGKFMTKVYRFRSQENEIYFSLVDEENYPLEHTDIEIENALLEKLKENLSTKLSYSEGIVLDQKISILSNYVLPSLTFNKSKDICFYNYKLFKSDHIIFGAPGSGKTTLLRRLAYDMLENSFSTTENKIRRLPVYIQLRDFNNYESDFDTFIDFSIKNSFAEVEHILPKNIGNWGNLFLLLDGADEIDYEKFHSFTSTIFEYKQKYPLTYFIITSRPDRNYENIPSFNHCKIEPFSRQQIRELTYRKLGSLHRWKDFMSVLNIVPQIYEVLKNPLLLTFSHYLFIHKNILPTNTAQLLKELVSTLISNWDTQRNIERKYQDKVVSPIRVSHTLGMMSLYLTDAKRHEITVTEMFSKFKHFDHIDELLHFLQFVKFSTGLIQDDENGNWRFIHKSIQDYFCSSILTESVSALRDKVFIEKDWASVLQMISGLSSDPGYIMNNIFSQSGRSTEEKLESALSIYSESMLLNKEDIRSVLGYVEDYFTSFEASNFITSKEVVAENDNIFLRAPESGKAKKLVSVISALLNARFSKYEYDFSGYFSTSQSLILRLLSPFTTKKGNMKVSFDEGTVRVSYEDESPEIKN